MTLMYSKAIFVLRILDEMKAYFSYEKNLAQIFKLTGWSEKEFHQVDEYLVRHGWVKRLYGFVREGEDNPEGSRSITHLGADALTEAMAHRIPLGLLAERVACWLNEHDHLGQTVSSDQVVRQLGIDEAAYELVLRELQDLDLVEVKKHASALRSERPRILCTSVALTSAGRLAVKRGFAQPDALPIAPQTQEHAQKLEKASKVPEPDKKDMTELSKILSNRLNDSELHSLCFNLEEIEYDNLAGETKNNKVEELVAYYYRREQLAQLKETIKKLRPDISFE